MSHTCMYVSTLNEAFVPRVFEGSARPFEFVVCTHLFETPRGEIRQIFLVTNHGDKRCAVIALKKTYTINQSKDMRLQDETHFQTSNR